MVAREAIVRGHKCYMPLLRGNHGSVRGSFGELQFNQPVARHNALRDALADALKDVGIACQKEVAIGGARRPADLALPNLDQRGPTAIDLVVHHPLCPSASRGGDERGSLKRAEEHKREESEELCHGYGWLFAPMGWHTWGGVGPHAGAMLARIENTFAGDLQGWPRRNAIADFRRKLTFALMAFIAKQLKVAQDVLLGEAPGDAQAAVALGPVFAAPELVAWESEDPDPVFVGPVRFRGVRPTVQRGRKEDGQACSSHWG